MHISVTFRHIESSDALRDYAGKKIEKIEKYLVKPIEAHFVMSVEKFRHIAEVTINTNGVIIKGEESTDDMYSAIDLVIAKLERRAKKYKERLKEHKANVNTSENTEDTKDTKGEPAPRVIRDKNFYAKPMSIDEAVMQMDVVSNEFLVFTDARSDNINVIYRRKDGNYGLIDPISKD